MFLCFEKVITAPSEKKKKKTKKKAEIMENQGGNDLKRLHNLLLPQRGWAGEGTLGVYQWVWRLEGVCGRDFGDL